GNPTVDELAVRPDAGESFARFIEENRLSDKPIIALLPGSRLAEIHDNLKIMIEAASAFPAYQLVIAGAPGVSPDFYRPYVRKGEVSIVFGKTYRLLQQARAALVTSGTATLETALLRVPQVVGYYMRGGRFTYAFFRSLIKVNYVSLVNLIADAPVVEELLVHHFTAENARRALAPLLDDTPQREAQLRGYEAMALRLGPAGAPQRAARLILQALSTSDKK
ncbi:MAG: lipid-A-disaccharide synthase, partial [Porphyromonadaceae bacterium]|nr:lipid-A-disaccharide synthase [Porphyromonadaceae bacterium]